MSLERGRRSKLAVAPDVQIGDADPRRLAQRGKPSPILGIASADETKAGA
jgi:hypothetical protein